jgi:hypothetical protein
MKIKSKIWIAGFSILLWACTNMAPEMIPEEPGPDNCTPQFPEMNVTYENFVKKIVTQYCVSCHYGGNSPGPGDFRTYNGLKDYTGASFYAMVISDQADMPQGNAPLPKSMRDSLNIWIQNCTPEK